MLKFIKYEIKGTYKYILGVLALVLIIFTGMYNFINNASRGSFSVIGNVFAGLSFLILFGSSLAIFLYIVGSFKKELYEDRGYLTFSLPLRGIEIVASKLIVALLWFLFLGFVIALYNFILLIIFLPKKVYVKDLVSALSFILQRIPIRYFILVMFITLFNLASMLVLIYFSMVLGRVSFRNKRIGSLWFVIFLMLSGILIYLQGEIAELLPYYLDLSSLRLIPPSDGNMLEGYKMMLNRGILSVNIGFPIINIAGSIYKIAMTVLLFLGTGYFIENKMDI